MIMVLLHDLAYSDRRIQVEKIAQTLGISHGSVSTILHGRLSMRKLTAHWDLKSITMSKWQPEHQYAAPF